jgi:hypothetical protein
MDGLPKIVDLASLPTDKQAEAWNLVEHALRLLVHNGLFLLSELKPHENKIDDEVLNHLTFFSLKGEEVLANLNTGLEALGALRSVRQQ